MQLRSHFLGALVWVAIAVFSATLASAEPPVKKALLLGVDGTRFDALRKAQTPNFDAVLEAGIYADDCLILGERYRKNDTISGPGWSSILTGVWADKHGVHDNSFKGRNYDAHPHFFSLLKRQRPEARTVSLATWGPIDEYIVRGADDHRNFDGRGKTYAESDSYAAEEAVKQIADPKLDCLFLYFVQVDGAGHRHGFHPSVSEYIAAIENVDAHFGRVLAAIRARPTFEQEDWLVVVTSDHGGKGTDHSKGHQTPEILNSFLIVSGSAAERGKFDEPTFIVDAPRTVLEHLGVKPDPAWSLDGQPRGLRVSN